MTTVATTEQSWALMTTVAITEQSWALVTTVATTEQSWALMTTVATTEQSWALLITVATAEQSWALATTVFTTEQSVKAKNCCLLPCCWRRIIKSLLLKNFRRYKPYPIQNRNSFPIFDVKKRFEHIKLLRISCSHCLKGN